MPRHLLHWLLVSFLQLLPGALPRSFIGVNEPMLRCSVEDVADWLTIQDLGKLVAQWAYKEGITPVRVLHLLENGLQTSAQVHSPITSLDSKIDSIGDSNKGYSRITFVHNRPSVQTEHHRVPLPPGSMFPPPPPQSSQVAGLPPMSFSPPALPFNPPSIRQPFPNLPSFGALRPPPDVIVRISDEVFGNPIPPVSITVSPRMTMAEVLMQAAVKFAEEVPISSSDINFYKVAYGHSSRRECYVIKTVGNLSTTGNYVWEATVSGPLGQEIWRGVCLPTLSEVFIRPGMVITLNYVKQDVIEDI